MAVDPTVFILQTQVYAGVRRVLSRVIDVEYLNESREYAHTILSLAEKSGDHALVKLCADLRTLMKWPVPARVEKAGSGNESISGEREAISPSLRPLVALD